MKKYIKMTGKALAALAMSALVVIVSSCGQKDNEVWYSDVPYIYGAQDHAATLELGQTLQLSANDLEGTGVEWFTSNEDVATVSADGLVTAVNLGTATITVYPKDYTGSNGNYVVITVVDLSLALVKDDIDQSEAE